MKFFVGRKSMREKVLNVIGNNLETVIKEDLKNIVTNKKMEKEFLECGDFIGTYENSFDNALLETFSRENLQVIYRKLKGVNGYEYIEKLKLFLEKLCEEYQVEGRDYFIEQFINMFKDCIYRNDRTLAQEIFSADFRVDMNQNFAIARERIDLLNSKVDLLFVSMNKDSYNNAQIPLPDNREMLNNEEQNLLEWKLIHPKRDDSKDNIKERVKYLTVLWKKERQAVPGWYVIPKNKRKELELYTREYEYIYNEDILSFRELFEFAHEVIWRFEMGFMKYSMKMQNRIHEIWMCASEKNDFLNNTEVKGKYFFIGQVLLRMYRENMMDELWHLIYEKLEKCSGYIDTGRDELYLEKIKYSFMKMNISEVCILLNDRSRINEKSYSVRMQIVGLKAECGMLDDAVKELNFLESALETEIEKEKKNSKQKAGMVYYSSILACSYFLHRFIYQAINLQTRDETFNKLTNKVILYQQYFDYEKERDEFYKDLFREQKKMRKKTPFELGRINRIICQGGRVPGSGYQFYRMLDRTAIPLHMRWVRLLDADESDFILNLIDDHPYIGWYMLLRLGESDTTKATLTRRECIEIIRKDGSYARNIFSYVYKAVDITVGNIQEKADSIFGTAYEHILLNGLEILRRFASIANITEQKKLVVLMIKIIDADVVRRFRVLNDWIRQVMNVLDERVKISMLNELLQCSGRKRATWHNEPEVDPFDVFTCKTVAINDYQKIELEPCWVNSMLDSCLSDEQQRMHYIPRLGKLAEVGMLTSEQSKKFGEVLWENMGKNDFPLKDTYYLCTYLKWPYPENIDLEARIKKSILSEAAFEKIRKETLLSIIPDVNRMFWEIRNINDERTDFWKETELKFLIKELRKCWITLKNEYEIKSHKSFYEDEFKEETRALINVFSSFERNAMQRLDEVEKKKIFQMIDEMEKYDIPCIELHVLAAPDDEIKNIVESIIEGFKSAHSDIETSAMCAVRVLLMSDVEEKYINQICNEMLILCRFRKEPGLSDYLIALYNTMYLHKLKLNKKTIKLMSAALTELAEWSDYSNLDEDVEEKIKNIIDIRKNSAGLANQLYLYEEGENIEHSKGALIWKEICRGEKSCVEFSEVKNNWY